MEKVSLSLGSLGMDCDGEAGVLYMSSGLPLEVDDSLGVDGGVIYRLRVGEVIGVTITGFKGDCANARRPFGYSV
jgi:hypothetical protein